MANGNNATIGFEKQIWDAACVLWGHIPAAEYRKVIVGLIFLRYISNAFEKRYQELVAEGDGFEDDRDALAEFNSIAIPALTQMECSRLENTRLTALRDALLPKLMSGELDVSAIKL